MPNPAGICYNNFTGVDAILSRNADLIGWLFIAGRSETHYLATKWQLVRALGANVLAYWNFIERPDKQVSAADNDMYMGDPLKVPLWKYPTSGARVNYANSHLADITDPVWQNAFLDYARAVMLSGKCDGAMMDVAGGQLWSTLAAWDVWPKSEQTLWTAAVRKWLMQLDALRRRVNPKFQLIVNNDPTGTLAESNIDGRVLEHPNWSTYQTNSASRSYSNMGNRCVLVIAKDAADVARWAPVSGVTHITCQAASQYGTPLADPAVPINHFEEVVRLKLNRDAIAGELSMLNTDLDALDRKLAAVRAAAE